MTVDMTTLPPLLAHDEPPPFTLINPEGAHSLVLVCDHASNRIPRCLHQLGMSDADLASHIAWDPGAAAVAIALSARLDAALIMSGYSRLVIDCNRPLSSPELIPSTSAGIAIPGNQGLSVALREQRIQTFFEPYQHAIATLLESRPSHTTRLLSIHSFTPCLNGQQRPWHIGVAAYRNHHFARELYQALQQPGDRVVGFNHPYAIETEFDYTVPYQGEARGLPSAMIEIRQDGLSTAEDVAFWVERLACAVQASLH